MAEPVGLKAWERLVVGPPRIEKDRLRVAYTIVKDGEEHTRDLTFKWAFPVLDPATDAHLGALIGAQVALNYALFCRELVIHGPLDPADREFLVAMAHALSGETDPIPLSTPGNPDPYADGLGWGASTGR